MRDLSTLLALVGAALVVADFLIKVLAVGVLPSNRKPSSAMAWLILILLIPFAGLFLFLMLGRTDVGAKRLARQREANAETARRPTGCPSRRSTGRST